VRSRDDATFDVAKPENWLGIWPVFREVVSTGDTYVYPPEIDEVSARAVWMGDAATRRVTYVARVNGCIVGSAYLRPNAPGLADHIANAGWIVSVSCRGRGIGRRFAEFVMDKARLMGYRAMQFNAVVSTNTGAVALWESLGFRIVGTVPEAFRHRTLGLTAIHIIHRKL
jgi:RimJ/RimL family protein N-acetyltransferase